MKKVLLFVGLGVILVIGAGIATLFISGRVALVVKEPGEQVVTYRSVCSSETQDKYIAQFGNQGLLNKEQINAFVDPIKKKGSWDKDATCLYMVMQAAVANGDKVESKRLADMQKSLGEKGFNIPNNLSKVGVAAEFAEEAAGFDPSDSMGGM